MLLIARYALLSMLVLFCVSTQAKNNILGPLIVTAPSLSTLDFISVTLTSLAKRMKPSTLRGYSVCIGRIQGWHLTPQ